MEKENFAKHGLTYSVSAGENMKTDSEKKKNGTENVDNSTKSIAGKGAKSSKTKHTCLICMEVIVDSTPRKPGHDSIFCDGECQSWIHRRCAGLSKLAFSKLCSVSNTKPFYCPNCRLEQQSLEISELKSTLSKVVVELAKFKENVSKAPSPCECSETFTSEEGSPSSMPLLYSKVASADCSSTPVVARLSKATRASVKPPGSKTTVDTKKFNLVVYGIKECEKGLARMKRVLSDIETVCKSVKLISPDFSQHQIKDCFRLGKYSESLKRPRPLLVKLNSVSDVVAILSKRTSLPSSSNVYIKPDLSASERKQELVLLKERRVLMNAGIERKLIKLRGNKLYVGGEIRGQVVDGVFVNCDPGSNASILHKVSTNSDSGHISQSTPSTQEPDSQK